MDHTADGMNGLQFSFVDVTQAQTNHKSSNKANVNYEGGASARSIGDRDVDDNAEVTIDNTKPMVSMVRQPVPYMSGDIEAMRCGVHQIVNELLFGKNELVRMCALHVTSARVSSNSSLSRWRRTVETHLDRCGCTKDDI